VKIIVIGAGGVGGYYGGVLARAGHEVTLFARGAHHDAIRDRGLEVRAPDERFMAAVAVTDDPAALPPADAAVVAVKSYSLNDVLPAIDAAARGGAAILPLMNGVTPIDDIVASGVSRGSMLGGLTRISAKRPQPGVVERLSPFQLVVLGELDGTMSERAASIADAFRSAGVESRVSSQIGVELWQKFVFIAAMAACCGMSRTAIGPIRDAPLGGRLIERAVSEVVAVAQARGVPLPDGDTARAVAQIMGLPATMKPSFLFDLEAGGPNELDILSGAVSRMGAALGVGCPVHDTVVTIMGARE
jgi:2-dehydropantoate 2-reductase